MPLQISAKVVVGRSTPEVWSQCLAILQHLLTLQLIAHQETIMLVEFHAELLARNNQVVVIIVIDSRLHGFHIVHHHILQVHIGSLEWVNHQLVFRHLKVDRQQSVSLLQLIAHIEQPLAMLAGLTIIQQKIHRLMRSHRQVFYPARLLHLAVVNQLPIHVVVRQVTEEVLVIHTDDALVGIHHLCPDVLVVVAHLIHVRVRHTVRTDQTIVAEVLVAGIKLVEVATIAINHLAVLLPTDRLIHEVPDKATLVLRILADDVPILLETTFRVTHRMGIFALDKRLGLGWVFTVFDGTLRRHVHRTMDIRLTLIASTLILNRTSCILSLDPVVGRFKVGTIASLVTHRPEDDGRMVVVALHIALVALQMSQFIIIANGQGLLAIAHSVRFHIGLSHHINTILITQIIPIRIIRIMTSPDTVDIEFLHDLDILNHAFARHHIASIRIQFVTVGPLEKHSLSVHQHLRILDLYLAETHLNRNHLHHIGTILQGSLQSI